MSPLWANSKVISASHFPADGLLPACFFVAENTPWVAASLLASC